MDTQICPGPQFLPFRLGSHSNHPPRHAFQAPTRRYGPDQLGVRQIHMKFSILLTFALLPTLLYGLDEPKNTVELFTDKIEVQQNGNGKDLIIEIREIFREKTFSEVVVIKESGASVPSTMFVVKGMYSIAKARNVKYFINLKEWKDNDGSYHYIIGFSNDNEKNPREQFLDLYDPSKDLKFMSVDQFSKLFEKN